MLVSMQFSCIQQYQQKQLAVERRTKEHHRHIMRFHACNIFEAYSDSGQSQPAANTLRFSLLMDILRGCVNNSAAV